MDFKGDKIRSTPFFGGEKFSHVSHPRFTCFAARWQTNQD
jgi:hypothetical protein